MMQLPTFAEFKYRLSKEFDCAYKVLPGSLSMADGPAEPVNYFERTIGGETFRKTISYPDDERLMPSVIRSVCDALKIDKSKFGLDLG